MSLIDTISHDSQKEIDRLAENDPETYSLIMSILQTKQTFEELSFIDKIILNDYLLSLYQRFDEEELKSIFNND